MNATGLELVAFFYCLPDQIAPKKLTQTLQFDYKESTRLGLVMDLFIIELVCWGGLLFFFWALKDGLSRVESDIESIGLLQARKAVARKGAVQYYKPEQAREQIGTYRDEPIYRYVVIDGQTYQFDHVLPPESATSISDDERCVVPGLVYLACQQCNVPLAQA